MATLRWGVLWTRTALRGLRLAPGPLEAPLCPQKQEALPRVRGPAEVWGLQTFELEEVPV